MRPVPLVFFPVLIAHVHCFSGGTANGRSPSLRASRDPGGSTTKALSLVEELTELGAQTDRGFRAGASDRKRAKLIAEELKGVCPCSEPASAFYAAGVPSPPGESSLLGRWKLIYTDAPDITGLEAQGGPFAQLGRIGQECSGESSTIANVITWRPAGWIRDGLSSTRDDIVEQRVVLRAASKPSAPRRVELFVEGLDIFPKTVLGRAFDPVEVRGPLSGQIPFGAFEIIYLDDTFRVVRTGQGCLAVNARDD
mmetsp:Transcript_64690/g.145935  ORF Transcript_64690/g.145935 Transcript_64690/m.145935 type:complete len:253 (+) Transcript_64690:118-876(+)|eukprot:CAMPEP_0172639440 /NCGR_PEP_ID=MMETSP1068-20121228/218540_1 /TAXON_ID=35684 /ORGANISM="Pseudopedinella elastica, Strain CCMP716" /LENGTH=252 /DNA_ID=CAMNT_0013452585 /DNA_START=46 /DNA_END=804 /DNA_ORIENTATION=+